MYDVITFGSATQDVFLQSSTFVVKTKKSSTDEGVCLPFGSKVEVKDIYFDTGGGGTNTAVSFARLGLKTAFCGNVGYDLAGVHILRELRKEGVGTEYLMADKRFQTAYSVIISHGGERSVLVYRGANAHFHSLPHQFQAKWLYLAPLTGKSIAVLPKIISSAHAHGAVVALNPSKELCSTGLAGFPFRNVHVLILNQEEGSILTGQPFHEREAIFSQLCGKVEHIVAMTAGKEGVWVCDGTFIYHAVPPQVKVADSLGAGDAFGSGFVAGLILKKDVEYAIRLGIANAVSVIQKVGAKNGLLRKRDISRLQVTRVTKTSFK
ncbi:carbohydrate kinase family protein [Candidatus Woesearchaeota archaeon]|nr:carbohydrate kinase family protein [Candidatus Woesearchaeota archaeon]